MSLPVTWTVGNGRDSTMEYHVVSLTLTGGSGDDDVEECVIIALLSTAFHICLLPPFSSSFVSPSLSLPVQP